MNNQTIRFRLGIFVLTALILLAVLAMLFGGFPNYFQATDSYVVEFDNAPGVTPGTPVQRSGVRIGQVNSVKLDNETGKVRVTIGVDPSYTLRKADRPTLTTGLLAGDATIAFMPLPGDAKKLDPGLWPPGSTIPGYSPPDAGQLVQKAVELIPSTTEALMEIRQAFARLDKLAPVVEETFKEVRDVAKSAREAMPELRKTGQEIQTAAQNLGKAGQKVGDFLSKNEDKLVQALDRMQETMKKLTETLNEENQKNLRQVLANLRKASDRFDGIAKSADDFFKEGKASLKTLGEAAGRVDEVMNSLQKATKGLGERGPAIMKNLEEGTDKLNKTLGDVRELLNYYARSEGTVQKLLTDPALYNNLNDSAAMVTRILPRLDRILRDVETFADKIARHPETLGVSGVIRPSSGAKDVPWWRTVPNYP